MRGRWGLTPRGVIAVVFDDTDRHNRVLQMFKKKPQRGCGFSEGAEKKRKRGSGRWWWGEITTRQNILGGEKCLKNCCGRELKRWYWDFLLPQLGFILFSNISHRKGAKKKKKSLEVRRWGRGPSLPSELRSHLEKTSASLINLSSASPGGRPLAPHTHTSSSTLARRTWRNARCTESLRCVYRPTCHFAICRSLSP